MTTASDTPALLTWLAPLSDLARLRILRLLSDEELSVGELAMVVQLPQSTVSRHLKLLSESSWIVKRTDQSSQRVSGQTPRFVQAGQFFPEGHAIALDLARTGTLDTLRSGRKACLANHHASMSTRASTRRPRPQCCRHRTRTKS